MNEDEYIKIDGEIWKTIKGYSNFQISNKGRVKSVSRKIRFVHAVTGEEHFRQTKDVILKLIKDKRGYYSVSLRGDDGLISRLKIHRLVAEAFIPNPNDYKIINHIDGIKSNNCSENLEWCNHQQNMAHSILNGLSIFGERHCKAKLTNEFVELLKIKMALGFNDCELSREYGISSKSISAIRCGRKWKHIIIPDGIIPIKSRTKYPHERPVAQINCHGDIVRKFSSYSEAARYFHIGTKTIRDIVSGKIPCTKKGLIFANLQ